MQAASLQFEPPAPWGFPCGSVVKDMTAKAGDVGDVGLMPGSGSSLGVGNGNPLQYSCLENFKDRAAWWAIVHGVVKSWRWLSMHTGTAPRVIGPAVLAGRVT